MAVWPPVLAGHNWAVEFEVSLDFVVVSGEEGCEAGHEGIDVAAFDVIDKTINRELVANKSRSVELAERMEKTCCDLLVWVVEVVGIETGVISLDIIAPRCSKFIVLNSLVHIDKSACPYLLKILDSNRVQHNLQSFI